MLINLFNFKIKKLKINLKQKAGRNNSGKITIKNRGGGNKTFYRIIDYKRYLYLKAIVLKNEKFKSNSATISLILYENGLFSYIIAAHNLIPQSKINDYNSFTMSSSYGSNFLIKHVFVGSLLYNVGIYPGKQGQIARAAGSYVQLINFYLYKKKLFLLLKLKSKKEYLVQNDCISVLGVANYSMSKYYNPVIKAGKNRNIGKRPHVRGVAMNPIDHPHGGNTSGGRCSTSPTNVLSKGYKTKKRLSFRIINN